MIGKNPPIAASSSRPHLLTNERHTDKKPMETLRWQLTLSHHNARQPHTALVPIFVAVELFHPVLPDLSHQCVKSIFHTLNANDPSKVFSFLKLLRSLFPSSQNPLAYLERQNSTGGAVSAYPIARKGKKSALTSKTLHLGSLTTPPGKALEQQPLRETRQTATVSPLQETTYFLISHLHFRVLRIFWLLLNHCTFFPPRWCR